MRFFTRPAKPCHVAWVYRSLQLADCFVFLQHQVDFLGISAGFYLPLRTLVVNLRFIIQTCRVSAAIDFISNHRANSHTATACYNLH